jgi:hypothetical protein
VSGWPLPRLRYWLGRQLRRLADFIAPNVHIDTPLTSLSERYQ